MIRTRPRALVAGLAAAAALLTPAPGRAAPAGAESSSEGEVWDPSRDEGVPQDQLFKAADEGRSVPGARVSRRPVTAAQPEAAPAEAPAVAGEELEPVEVVRPRRARERASEPSAEAAPEPAAPEAEPAPEPARARPAAAPAPAPARPRRTEADDGRRRIQLFLVPIGQAAALAAGATQAALEGEIARLPGYRPVDLVEELRVAPSTEETRAYNEARKLANQGDKLLRGRSYDEAANRYRAALRQLEGAGTAGDAVDRADLFVRLGTALMLAGEEAAAQEAMRAAARCDHADTLDGRDVDRRTPAALGAARREVAEGPLGVLSVVTNPPGARIFLGGVYRGVTPLTIDRAPAGVNFLRLDRPGAYPEVSLVEVKEGLDTPVKLRMRFTPEAMELQRTLAAVPDALDRSTDLPDMVRALGHRFRLDRALVSVVKMESTNQAAVRLCVFDFGRDARLADEKLVLSTDIEGGLEAAVSRWARAVLDGADRSRNRQASDPLDRSDGTEDWYSTKRKARSKAAADDRPEWERKGDYRGPEKSKKDGVESKDPLDHVDGMEDW